MLLLRHRLEAVWPLASAVEKGEHFDTVAVNAVGNEEWSGWNYQFTSSGNASTASDFGVALQ